jgi:hypothetical protein
MWLLVPDSLLFKNIYNLCVFDFIFIFQNFYLFAFTFFFLRTLLCRYIDLLSSVAAATAVSFGAVRPS